jgi:hypothetical protein
MPARVTFTSCQLEPNILLRTDFESYTDNPITLNQPSDRLQVLNLPTCQLESKQVLTGAKIEAFRNTFANLALPLFAMAEPIEGKKFKFKDMEWSMWDRWIIEGDITVKVGPRRLTPD